MATRVLIADDHQGMRDALSQTVRMIDRAWEIYEAIDGRAALEIAGSWKPDLVILDWRMPNLNGLEAGRAIRKLLPNAVMLIYTATPAVYLEPAAHEAGFQGVVEKLDGRGLVTAICNALPLKAFAAAAARDACRRAPVEPHSPDN